MAAWHADMLARTSIGLGGWYDDNDDDDVLLVYISLFDFGGWQWRGVVLLLLFIVVVVVADVLHSLHSLDS